MNEIKLFNFKNNNVSSLSYEDQIYFFPEEIGEILGFEDLSNSIRNSFGLEEPTDFKVFRFDDLKDIKKLMAVKRVRGVDDFVEKINSKLLITEPGLYALIMRSIKPEAMEFKRWLAREVLPSIRKHGAYLTPVTMENWLDNPDIMINALIELKRTREVARLEREAKEEAIRTKAEIGSRREATAMQTASVKAKEVKKLEIELGKAREYASTIAVSKYFGKTKDVYPWQPLKRFCIDNNLEVKKEFNACYGNINCYPAEAWEAAYGIDITAFIR